MNSVTGSCTVLRNGVRTVNLRTQACQHIPSDDAARTCPLGAKIAQGRRAAFCRKHQHARDCFQPKGR
eukprot:68820-Rhodomonas_salina.2